MLHMMRDAGQKSAHRLYIIPVLYSKGYCVYISKSIKKGQCHEIFDFWFFHESVSPKPLSILLGPFSNIRNFATGVVDTGGAP
jgi:hypothetical protein